ncbi:MAG: hypothetical protein KGI84_00785 [Elusimicrobia bacterium]|nr:hypothetical protein [Elusimicrobiota bacterium]
MSRISPGPFAGRIRALLAAAIAASVLLAVRSPGPAAEIAETSGEAPALPGAFPAVLPAPLTGPDSPGLLPAQDLTGLDELPGSSFAPRAVLAPPAPRALRTAAAPPALPVGFAVSRILRGQPPAPAPAGAPAVRNPAFAENLVKTARAQALNQTLARRAKAARRQISDFEESFMDSWGEKAAAPPARPIRPGRGRDVTAEHALAGNRGFTPEELHELRRKTVLVFVGGLLSNHLRHSGKAGETPQYFEGITRFAEHYRIPYRTSNVNTEQPSEQNAARLAAIVEEEANRDRRVVFIPHSHGALDVLRALEALEASPVKRRLLDRVSWIPIQGPFLGAEGADRVVEGPYKRLIYFFLESLGGSRRSILEMTTASSQEHYRTHKRQIERILRRVPTVALAGYLSKPRAPETMPGPWSVLERIKVVPAEKRRLMASGLAKAGIKSDGLVPLSNQFFPEMERVILRNLSHFDALLARGDTPGRRVFIGLLRMILARRKAREFQRRARKY